MSSLIRKLSHGFASKMFLLCTDLAGLFLLFSVVHQFRMGWPIGLTSGPMWAIVLITLVTLYIMDVYRTEEPITRARLPLQTFLAVPVAGLFTAVFIYALGVDSFISMFGRGVMPIAFFLFSFWAAGWRWLLTWLNQRYQPPMQWTLLSDSKLLQRILTEFDSSKVMVSSAIDVLDEPASLQALQSSALSDGHSGIVIGTQERLGDAIASRIMQLRFAGVTVLSLSEFCESYWSRVPVLHLQDGWFAQASGFQRVHDQVGLRFQRLVDIVVSIFGLLLFSPVFVLLAVLIKLDSKGPVTYCQTRVGLYGAPFTIYKLRTMVADAELDGPKWAAERDPRITGLGRFLRASRLDEWPQLWNVLKGEMSLIGPRPERPNFVELLKAEVPYYDLRHLVPPGITGWAQVMYRYGSSTLDARKKLEYDLYYIKNHSIQLDFAILVKTVLLVFKRAGR